MFFGDVFASDGCVGDDRRAELISPFAIVVEAEIDFILAFGARESRQTIADGFPDQRSVRFSTVRAVGARTSVCRGNKRKTEIA